MCAANVPDGRTLLVTATPRGAVRLWDPASGEPAGRLNPYGSPIRSMAAVPISAAHTLIAAPATAGRVHVWDPAVDDPWEPGVAVQLSGRALADPGRPLTAVAAVPTHDATLLATADGRGAVRLGTSLPAPRWADVYPPPRGTAASPS